MFDTEGKKNFLQILLEQTDDNRISAEQEAIDFLRTLDKDFLLQYMPLDEYKSLFESGYPLEFDGSIQDILSRLLLKFKRHYESINDSIYNFSEDKSINECNVLLDKLGSNKCHVPR